MATEKYLIQIKVDIQNDKQLQALTTQLQKVAKTVPKAQRVVQSSTKGLRNYGHIAQNVGFQVQDMAVQIQGGTSAMRAMSQQLPQMLVGFGAVGAAIGVVFALMPALISSFTDAASATQSMGDELDDLDKSFGSLSATVTNVDMSSWIKSFNDLDASARGIAKSLLDVRIQLADIALEGALEQFTSFSDSFVGGKFNDIQLHSMAANLGIVVGDMEELIALVNSTDGSILGDPVALERMVEILGDAGSEKMLSQLQRLLQMREDLNEASAASSAAGAAGAAGIIATGTDELEEVKLLAPGKRAEFLIQQNDYNEGLIQAALGQEAFNATLVESAEAYSIMDEATGIFLNTFDSAVDGVARGTQSMSDAFESMAKSIIAQLLKLAAIQAIGGALSGQGGFLGSLGAALLAEKGAVVSGGQHLTAYAKGGVVNSPTIFPMKNGLGLMGEKSAEAVLPLSRMSNGNLGVESSGMNVVINNNAAGVSVQPRQTEAGLTIDVVMNAVSSAVRRGGNEIASSIEDSYALNRGRGVYGS